jgi:hypothetical protein
MTVRRNQGIWAPGGGTVRQFRSMRLARADSEKMWRGLEEFVNCDDSLGRFQVLGRSFSNFWPVKIYLATVNDGKRVWTPGIDEAPSVGVPSKQVAWDKVCHRLFLFYRDTLRTLWCCKPTELIYDWEPKFLLGIDNSNADACLAAGKPTQSTRLPLELLRSWQDICDKFPTAIPDEPGSLYMHWGYGDFLLLTRNDFVRAFYLLFRQSWRARVCPSCKLFFVARRPKQRFCGTSCSASSRLASKRKWWKRVGAKRRAARGETRPNRNRGERKHR